MPPLPLRLERGLRLMDYVAFAHKVLKDQAGNNVKMASIHLAQVAHVNYAWEHGMGALINAPMAHAKTTYFAVGMPLYLLGLNPSSRIQVICATDPLARDRVTAIRGYIEEDDDYRRVFPAVRPSKLDKLQARKAAWSRNRIMVARPGHATDASIIAAGIMGSGVGTRADYQIYDDPIDQKNSRSEIGRKDIADKFKTTWMTRLEPTARWLMISTPYHQDDLNHELRKNPRVCTLIIAVSLDFKFMDYKVINAPDDQHPLMQFRKK